MNDNQLRRTLAAMGKTFFVKYYALFANGTVSQEGVILAFSSEMNTVLQINPSGSGSPMRVASLTRAGDPMHCPTLQKVKFPTTCAKLPLSYYKGSVWIRRNWRWLVGNQPSLYSEKITSPRQAG